MTCYKSVFVSIKTVQLFPLCVRCREYYRSTPNREKWFFWSTEEVQVYHEASPVIVLRIFILFQPVICLYHLITVRTPRSTRTSFHTPQYRNNMN